MYDIEMQARFLVALPLLIAGELLVHQQLRLVVGQFMERGIITEEVIPRFKEVIASAMKLRNSVAIELLLVILVFVVGNYLWSTVSVMEKIVPGAGTWYAAAADSGSHLSPAGYWYAFVSRPLFQFILLRWYFRLFIWARFLWQSSLLKLNLIPTHPDRAAGLGFLAASCSAFAPVLLAHGALLAGLIANSIFFAGAKLSDFKLHVDTGKYVWYAEYMKSTSAIILISMFFLLSTHVSTPRSHPRFQSTPSLFTLNVCHHSGNETLGGPDVPWIYESYSESVLLEPSGNREILTALLSPHVLAFQEERPPRY